MGGTLLSEMRNGGEQKKSEICCSTCKNTYQFLSSFFWFIQPYHESMEAIPKSVIKYDIRFDISIKLTTYIDRAKI